MTRGRVLFLTSNFPRWEGDSTTPFVLHLAEDLQDLGWNIHVVAPAAPGAAADEKISGVRVSRFRYAWPERAQTVCYDGGALVNIRNDRREKLKLPMLVAAEFGSLVRRLSTRGYSLLHSHWIVPQGFVGVLTARTLRVPHVTTVHGGDVFSLQSGIMQPFKRLALAGSDAVTVNSSATEERVQAISRRSVSPYLIPMGADVRRPDPEVSDAVRSRYRTGRGPLVVFVGRLVPEKGVFDLLEAFASVKQRLPDATLLIGGTGPSADELQEETAERGLGDSVHLVGWIDPGEVVSYMAAGDVVVGPSKESPDGWIEAFGLTMVEAMASGTPLIATRSGGIPDVVTDGETGILVEPGSPNSIAAEIERLTVTEPQLAGRISSAAQRRAHDRFSRVAAAEAFSDLYEALVSDRGNKR